MFQLLLAIIYLSFISLGLPDCMLGAAWPTMYQEFGVPVSYAGIISMIIAFGTIVSSLQSDRLTLKLGTGKVTAISVGMTALALLGFSMSHNFWMLCLIAIPYGLGAGSVDASLNNYVALHYESRHMSWLHCMWGVGAATGPYVMGFALSGGRGWNMGYVYIGILQVVLTAILFLSLPLWKGRGDAVNGGSAGESNGETRLDVAAGSTGDTDGRSGKKKDGKRNTKNSTNSGEAAQTRKPLSLREVLRIRGAREIMLAFFCYCGIEQTAMLWSASYLVMRTGMSATEAASFAGMFALGITAGRAVSGFMTIKFSDTAMIRIGQGLILAGIAFLLLPLGRVSAIGGLMLVGFGCAPIYPCIIHSTPVHFGADLSQAVVGVQMASAYTGTLLLPPLFGLVAQYISAALLPAYLLLILALMVFMHERLLKISR